MWTSCGKVFSLVLLLSVVSLPVFSLEQGPNGSVIFSGDEYQQIVKLSTELRQDLESLTQINKQQVTELTTLKTQLADLTIINEQQAGLLLTQRINLTSLIKSLESQKTESTIAEILLVISLIGNGIQLIK